VAVRIGTSGWSYPSWRPGFYPAGSTPAQFLTLYAAAFDTVELNTTGYRVPPREQFERWAAAVPDGFRFAPKLALRRAGQLGPFLARVEALGDRLGPLRVVVEQPRDDALLDALVELAATGLEVALDARHDSWTGQPLVAVNDPAAQPFRYLRLREPPYADDSLRALAATVHAPAYVFFRHEQEPTAPAYARRLRELLSAAPPPAPPAG
jgi:uncharacterized protein YecE (DUF72 family)